MDLVVDANILFSALIKEDSFSFNFFFRENFHLFTAEFIFSEFEKHKEEILKKTNRSEKDFFRILEILKKRIIIVPLEELIPFIGEAEKLSPDPGDMVYFALALKLNCSIWSNDKKLKEQNKIKVYKTHDLNQINRHS